MKQLTLLIVESLAIGRGVLKEIFDEQYFVLEAGDAQEALAILNKKQRVDLIFLTMGLKIGNQELLEILQNDVRFREIPVMVGLSENDSKEKERALAMGADYMFPQPLNPRLIKLSVQNIAKKYQHRIGTGMQELREDKARNTRFLDSFPGAVLEIHVSDSLEVIYFNQGLCTMCGYSKKQLQLMLQENPLGFLTENSGQSLTRLLTREHTSGKEQRHLQLVHAKGMEVWGNAFVCLKEIYGDTRSYYVTIQDVTQELTEKKLLENRVRKLKQDAERDPLTGLYTKETFLEEMRSILKQSEGQNFVMIVWAVDRFRVISELFGAPTAEQVLCRLADAFSRRIRRVGICGRVEEERFLICVEQGFFEQWFRELEEMLAGKGRWNCLNYPITSHMGLYRIADKDQSAEVIFERAMTAFQVIQENTLKRFNYYDENLDEMLTMGKKLLKDMESALLDREFQVFYQPLVDVQTKQVVGAEALVRWEHPKRGCISPGAFISLFEQNGFVTRLDMYVVEEICRYQQKRIQEGKMRIPISVNLSRIDFYNPDLSREILEMVQKYEISTEDLEIEISNMAYKDSSQELLSSIERFQREGFRVILDDFGSGYAFLNMLKDISVDILKVDMKFVKDSETSVRAGNILYNVIQMAKSLQMKIVVEGVETTQQYELLQNMGCDWIQGYYFAKPLPANELDSCISHIQQSGAYVSARGNRQVVLVVDDVALNREMIRLNIEQRYSVIEAADGLEAWDILSQHLAGISLVILDLQMPRMDGFQLLEKMQQSLQLKSIPVLVVTAYGDRENMTRALELGALDVVVKPYDMGVLKKRIENLFRISKQRHMEVEVQGLKAGIVMREEMQKLFGNSEASLCRMRFSEKRPYILREVIFANERFNYMHPNIYLGEGDARGWNVLMDRILPLDRSRIKRVWETTLQQKHQAFQSSYRLPGDDGQIHNMLLSCTMEHEDDSIIVNFVEIEVRESDYDQLGKALGVFASQIGMTDSLDIAFWDAQEDSMTYTLKRSDGTCHRTILTNASKSILENGWFVGEDQEPVRELMQRLQSGETFVQTQVRMTMNTFGDRKRYYWKRITCRQSQDGRLFNQNHNVVFIIAEDITKQKMYEKRRWREQQYREIVAKDAFLFSEIDLTENAFLTEDVRLEMLMYGVDLEKTSYDSFVQTWIEQYVIEEDRSACRTFMSREKIYTWYEEGEYYITFDFRSDMNHGREYEWYTSSMYIVKSEENGHLYGSWRIQNIQDEKQQFNRFKQLAERDKLTGLYNRFALEKHIANIFSQKGDEDFLAAFIMIDLDNFKAVNDNFGHGFGDNVLRAVGGLLCHTFRKDDVIARFGGDEFAVFIPQTGSREGILKRLDEVCERSQMVFDSNGVHISVSCSLGVVFAPEHGRSFSQLYKKADEALYEAKKAGKNQYQVYGEDF